MELRLKIPRINDDPSDYDVLFGLWEQLASDETHQTVVLDFAQCDFLRQNGVAFCLGLARLAQSYGKQIAVENLLNENVAINLRKNGFMEALGLPYDRYPSSTAVPVREDVCRNVEPYINYLDKHWLTGRGISLSADLKQIILSTVVEAYTNVFDHARSRIGAFTCGQFYPRLEELALTLVDFGIGIPATVRRRLNQPDLNAETAMRWVFQEGNTTQDGPRGNGLKILKQFVKQNEGSLDIYSENCHARISARGERFTLRGRKFIGTVVQIKLKSDDKFYSLSSEDDSDELFF